jgi:hypothetical protein
MSAENAVLLFGGRNITVLYGDTWRFDGTNWTQVASTGPIGRDGHSMAFASQLGAKTNRVVLFGGDSGTLTLKDTWEWNGSSWSAAVDGATSVFGHGLVYDSVISRVLRFGGGPLYKPLSELQHYDGTAWGTHGDSPASGRFGLGMAYDTQRGIAVTFGGENLTALQPGTWEWESAFQVWTERVVLVQPSPRSLTPLVYDQKRKRSVLFGGFGVAFPYADTWEYRALGGTCSTTAECDGVACVDGACCEAASCGSCSSCSSVTGLCTPVVGAEDPDSCSGDDICDSTGTCKPKQGVTCTTPADCASGFCADGVCCSAPCQGACEACDLPGSPGICTLVTGDARHGTCPGTAPCGSTCTGQSPSCEYTPLGSPCGSVCETSTLTASACDGQGVCTVAAPEDCANGFACLDGSACRTSCSEDSHCASDRVCRDGACVFPASTCLDDVTVREEDGSVHSCGAYTCASGACLANCTFAAQCADGFVCDAERKCVSVSDATSEEDEGCGCSLPGREPPVRGMLLLFGILVTACRTRRRGAGARTAVTP